MKAFNPKLHMCWASGAFGPSGLVPQTRYQVKTVLRSLWWASGAFGPSGLVPQT